MRVTAPNSPVSHVTPPHYRANTSRIGHLRQIACEYLGVSRTPPVVDAILREHQKLRLSPTLLFRIIKSRYDLPKNPDFLAEDIALSSGLKENISEKQKRYAAILKKWRLLSNPLSQTDTSQASDFKRLQFLSALYMVCRPNAKYGDASVFASGILMQRAQYNGVPYKGFSFDWLSEPDFNTVKELGASFFENADGHSHLIMRAHIGCLALNFLFEAVDSDFFENASGYIGYHFGDEKSAARFDSFKTLDPNDAMCEKLTQEITPWFKM